VQVEQCEADAGTAADDVTRIVPFDTAPRLARAPSEEIA
jgi:hypothetical protein